MARRDSLGELDLASRVARLTAGQRACLELVDDHATSKEIALRLGISRHTVDARLRQAMQTLGVTSRREAAVIWRTAAGTDEYQPFAYQPPHVAMMATPEDKEASATEYRNDAGEGDGFGDIGGSDAPVHAVPGHPGQFQPGQFQPGQFQPVSGPPPRDHRAMEVADAASLQWALSRQAQDVPAPYPTTRLWGGANDLTPAQRLIGILVVALLGMLAFGLLLSGIEALTTLRA